MKLQLNDTGAWKHVATTQAQDEAKVRELAHQLGSLAMAAGHKVKWRLLNDFDQVVAYWDHAQAAWRPARRLADATDGAAQA